MEESEFFERVLTPGQEQLAISYLYARAVGADIIRMVYDTAAKEVREEVVYCDEQYYQKREACRRIHLLELPK